MANPILDSGQKAPGFGGLKKGGVVGLGFASNGRHTGRALAHRALCGQVQFQGEEGIDAGGVAKVRSQSSRVWGNGPLAGSTAKPPGRFLYQGCGFSWDEFPTRLDSKEINLSIILGKPQVNETVGGAVE